MVGSSCQSQNGLDGDRLELGDRLRIERSKERRSFDAVLLMEFVIVTRRLWLTDGLRKCQVCPQPPQNTVVNKTTRKR